MAERLRKHHQDDVRRKIQVSQLINVLQDNALGKTEITDGRRQSAKILLDKSISNAPTELKGEFEADVTVTWLGKS